jgi:putative hydrolase of the HAD superfamily
MDIRAVIFDRDNTLVRFEPAVVAALEARVTTIAPSIPPGAAAAHWTTWPGPWPRFDVDEPKFWNLFWNSFAARYGLHNAATAALNEIGAFYHTCFSAFPDAAPCLRALRERGLRLAVLTNFELPSIHLTLRHAGLEPAWFAALLSSSTVGVRKPDPRAYRAALDALGLLPHQCVFVDDLPVNVEAAGALGMRGVLLDRSGAASPESVERVGDLHDLTARLTLRE